MSGDVEANSGVDVTAGIERGGGEPVERMDCS